MADMQSVNEADFQNVVLDSAEPVLVDFWATWCQPCKMLDPLVKQLAEEWQGKVKVVKLDADQNPEIVMKYSVFGIPTLLLFKGGQPVERLTGYKGKEFLISKFSPHIQGLTGQ